MFETISVDDALKRGHRMVNMPVSIIQMGSIIAGLFLVSVFKQSSIWIAVGFVVGFILAWLYWSFMITKWWIWAFDNVRNVHELKQRAIKERLIWNDGNWLEKTEIRTSADKDQLAVIEKKFLKKDVFANDYSVPNQTIVKYSKKNFVGLIAWTVCFSVGVYFIINEGNLLGGVIICSIAFLFGFFDLKLATNKKPQIILNNGGMETIETPYQPWRDIKEENVISEYTSRQTLYYLTYNYPGGSEKVQIDNLDITHKKLEHLLLVYRGRSENK